MRKPRLLTVLQALEELNLLKAEDRGDEGPSTELLVKMECACLSRR